MSLNTLKETLKHCSNVPIPPTTSSSTISDPINFNPSQKPRRIPPKISISQQLLRLQHPFSPPLKLRSNNPPQQQQQQRPRDGEYRTNELLKEETNRSFRDEDGEDEKKEEEDEIKQRGFVKPRLDVFQLGETGPYVPLVLSSPGEIPVIQVIGYLITLFFFKILYCCLLGFLKCKHYTNI